MRPPSRSILRSLPGILFACLVIVLALGNSLLSLYPFGYAVWIRPLLGLVGVVGAVCLFAGSGWWRILLSAWCLLQTWIIAIDPSRELFYQGLMAGFNYSSSTRHNHLLVAYQSNGVNYAGPILFLILVVIMACRLHPRVRRNPTLKTISRVATAAAMATLLGFAIHALGATDGPVLALDIPNVPIYYKGEMLGRTPLRITPALVADHHLPLNAKAGLSIFPFDWGDCAILSDGKTYLPLYAGPPWPFDGYLDTFDSPWGTRCRMQPGERSGDGSNLCTGYVFPNATLRGDPVLTIQMLDPLPIPAASPLRLHCVLTNPTAESFLGRKATITRLFFRYDQRDANPPPVPSNIRRYVTMPAAWNSVPAGASLTADLEFDGPAKPGDYELFCIWFLYNPSPNSDTGVASCHSNMLWLRVR